MITSKQIQAIKNMCKFLSVKPPRKIKEFTIDQADKIIKRLIVEVKSRSAELSSHDCPLYGGESTF